MKEHGETVPAVVAFDGRLTLIGSPGRMFLGPASDFTISMTLLPIHRLTGQILKDDIEIQELLGEGGMGVVYRAWQPSLKRDLCVKFMRPELLNNAQWLKRFKREALALSALRDEHVVSILFVGVFRGAFPYLVMEFVRGQSLRKLIDERGNLDWRLACNIFQQICDALAKVHSSKIVHRDLKPDNVFVAGVSGEEWVKILDFGLCTSPGPVADGTTLTGQSDMIGTVSYMAPECFKKAQHNPLVDVYAIGCMFYETLTGRQPFVADTASAMALMHTTQPVPVLPQSVAEVNVLAELNAFIAKACAKEPSDRFENCEQMSHWLRGLLDGTSLESGACPRRGIDRFHTTAMAVAVILAIAGVLLISLRKGSKLSGETPELSVSRRVDSEGGRYSGPGKGGTDEVDEEKRDLEFLRRLPHVVAAGKSINEPFLFASLTRLVNRHAGRGQLDEVVSIYKQFCTALESGPPVLLGKVKLAKIELLLDLGYSKRARQELVMLEKERSVSGYNEVRMKEALAVALLDEDLPSEAISALDEGIRLCEKLQRQSFSGSAENVAAAVANNRLRVFRWVASYRMGKNDNNNSVQALIEGGIEPDDVAKSLGLSDRSHRKWEIAGLLQLYRRDAALCAETWWRGYQEALTGGASGYAKLLHRRILHLCGISPQGMAEPTCSEFVAFGESSLALSFAREYLARHCSSDTDSATDPWVLLNAFRRVDPVPSERVIDGVIATLERLKAPAELRSTAVRIKAAHELEGGRAARAEVLLRDAMRIGKSDASELEVRCQECLLADSVSRQDRDEETRRMVSLALNKRSVDNETTIASLLSACGHSGDVNDFLYLVEREKRSSTGLAQTKDLSAAAIDILNKCAEEGRNDDAKRVVAATESYPLMIERARPVDKVQFLLRKSDLNRADKQYSEAVLNLAAAIDVSTIPEKELPRLRNRLLSIKVLEPTMADQCDSVIARIDGIIGAPGGDKATSL